MARDCEYFPTSHDDEVSRLKARIAELEALNLDLCERVTENDEIRLHWEEIEQTRAENERMKSRIAELEEERRWRKFSEEKPKDKQLVLVHGDNWFDTAIYHDNGLIDFDDDIHFSNITETPYWMPLPSAQKDGK